MELLTSAPRGRLPRSHSPRRHHAAWFRTAAQGLVNAGVAFFVYALNAVAHGLPKRLMSVAWMSVPTSTHDATRPDGTCMQVGGEQGFVFSCRAGASTEGQGTNHAAVQVFDAALAGFEGISRAAHPGLMGCRKMGVRGGGFALHGSE